MKHLFLLMLSMALFIQIHAQTVVQITAYETQVPTSDFVGLENVKVLKGQNDIYHYYIDSYTGDGQDVIQQAREAGYEYAMIVNLADYKNCCNIRSAPRAPSSQDRINKLKSIFFGFDKSSLRPESKHQLDLLYQILRDHPEYNTELRAHTDAKGSEEYNRALSQRRVDSAKNYLLAKGISSSRISTNTYGEGTPIAKNDLNGADTEEGRQLNRRVELLVVNSSGSILNGVVEEIEVPDYLKNRH